MPRSDDRLTIVQYAGDFREASDRLRAGGPETYRGQRYTVEHVEQLARRLASVTTITGFTDAPYDVTLPSGARAIGAGFRERFDGAAMATLVASTRPDRLILRTPSRPVLRWAMRQRCRTMLLLADSFDDHSLKQRLGRALLGLMLRASPFEIVANHGIKASAQLAAAGVPRHKILAWDYPAFATPVERPPKQRAGAPLRLIYVGMLIVEKGIDDLIDAVAIAASHGLELRLDIIGAGDAERLAAKIAGFGLTDSVTLVGLVPNGEIIPRMAAADIVIVPSRHSYSEGVPLTIYESYCSRTPIIVSDHPMFVGNVVHEASGLIFRADDPADLAAQIERLAQDPALYARLSLGGALAWEKLQLPVKWGDVIDRWLDDTPASRAWLTGHALARR